MAKTTNTLKQASSSDGDLAFCVKRLVTHTSYFAKYRGDYGVCIALKHPPGFKGKCYPALFPKWSFLSKYFNDHDEAAYTKAYYDQVLSKLDPAKVLTDLEGSALLCWETPKKFCHRHLVSGWLKENTGVDIIEA
jgi:hypothetical protein